MPRIMTFHAKKCFSYLVMVLSLSQQHVYAAPGIHEENYLLPIQVAGHQEYLEIFVARPANGKKLPIALITNGSAADDPKSVRADWLANLAHDFAHRGWLAASIVWPGYGRSSGNFMDEAGTCTAPDVGRFLDAHAIELSGALRALRERSDVDPTVALGIGFSIGGAAMLDLASQAARPLTAVINISGGVYHYSKPGRPMESCEAYQDDLVLNFRIFGRANPTPTLWLYSHNDPFFGPHLASTMVSNYRSEGGQADFFMLPDFERDGHTLHKIGAYYLLKPHIDEFLSTNFLPTTHDGELDAVLKHLPPKIQQDLIVYRNKIAEKALAVSLVNKSIFWNFGARSEEDAQKRAVEYCEAQTRHSCRLLATNNELVDDWRDALAEPHEE